MVMRKKMSYADNVHRIREAIRYIANNLNQPLNLNDIARNSNLSPYYFHRLFRDERGETLNDYITRKKMEEAVKVLIWKPDVSITYVAESGGFSSPANFSKAFKLYFGISPSELRNPETIRRKQHGKLYQKYGKEVDIQKLHPQSLTNSGVFVPEELERLFSNVLLVKRDETPIVYNSFSGKYRQSKIENTWRELIQHCEAAGIDTSREKRFSLFFGNPIVTPDSQCRYFASVALDDHIRSYSFDRTTIPAGQFAVFPYEGPDEHTFDFFREVHYGWLPRHGFRPGKCPFFTGYKYPADQIGHVKVTFYFYLEKLNECRQIYD